MRPVATVISSKLQGLRFFLAKLRPWRFQILLLALGLKFGHEGLVTTFGFQMPILFGVFTLLIWVNLLWLWIRIERARVVELSFYGVLVLSRAAASFFGREGVLMSSALADALFYASTAYLVIREVLTFEMGVRERSAAAIAGYLLIGVAFGESFKILAVSPANFGEILTRDDANYFSFTTLSTLGYGDISPKSVIARQLAIAEALLGQFYLGVLVAGLIGGQFGAKSSGSAIVPSTTHGIAAAPAAPFRSRLRRRKP